jgi:hypothetical protein
VNPKRKYLNPTKRRANLPARGYWKGARSTSPPSAISKEFDGILLHGNGRNFGVGGTGLSVTTEKKTPDRGQRSVVAETAVYYPEAEE